MSPTRLIVDPQPMSGAWNMAVDETLLESALASGTATIRVYQWSAPTVSLGYFQDPDKIERDPQWSGLAAVRRLSGGGAILHDREITYSITLPPSHALTAHPSRLYAIVHDALIKVLAEHGIIVRMRGDSANAVASGSPLNGPINGTTPSTINPAAIAHRPSAIAPFLCFGRGDPNDIVLGAHKIIGSAQRRRRGAILQHGSILLERSPHAPEFPGIAELTGIRLDAHALAPHVGAAITDALGGHADPSELTGQEQAGARSLEHFRYSSIRWTKPPASSPLESSL